MFFFSHHSPSTTAGLSIVPAVPWEPPPAARGPPINCQNFYHAVLTFERASLNVTTTAMTKKVVNFLGAERCTSERENPGYANEKRAPRLTLVWGPRMVNPALPATSALLPLTLLSPFWCGPPYTSPWGTFTPRWDQFTP